MGLNRWRQIGRRLAQMDRAELDDRVRQEFGKRLDAALARVGFDFGRKARREGAQQAEKFFFTRSSISEILLLLRQRLPGEAERIMAQAEKVCQHHFDLLGYTDLDYGSPIDWHLDAVHVKRAPRKSAYKIRYLDYEEVGDSKVTWELNRHQHLVTLAKAHLLSEDRRFAGEIFRQWRHWQVENPYPVGINWASSLEAAFRALSWMWTYHLLQGASGLPDFRDEWLRGLAVHGRFIERNLSTYFSPNTHLLGEGVALFFLGVLCPELAAAERWKTLGWKIILQEAERQVRADGFHFEQSTYYHVYALDFFLHSAVLANLNGIATPKSFEDAVEKMLTALCMLGRGGSPPRFGDDDGGRLFDARRNCGEHLLDPLATGAILFHRAEFKVAAVSLREETLWLLGAEGVRQWDELEETVISKAPSALPSAGLYMLTTDNRNQLVVDAGPQGTSSGGHGHADALSVCLDSHGHSLLIDPGTYEYVGSGGERDLFRGTAMHNTLRVDGQDQAEPASPFSWKRLTQTKVERWIQGKSFDLLVASHDGYQRLQPPVVHKRWVVSLRNGVYLIRDVVEGEGKHRLDLAWHLGPELQIVRDGLFRVKGASQALALLPVRDHGWAEEVRRESWSPAYGRKAPTTALNFSTETTLPAEFAVILVTLDEAPASAMSFTRMDGNALNAGARGYQYAAEDAEYSFIFGKQGSPWHVGFCSGDSQFACRRKSLGSTDEHLMLSGGSFVRLDAGLELRCPQSVEWAELVQTDTEQTMFSSESAKNP